MTKSYENKLKEYQIIWAKEKYKVLSKSQKIYHLIFGGHEHVRYANEVDGQNGDKT